MDPQFLHSMDPETSSRSKIQKSSALILILNRFVHVVNEWPLRLSDNKVTIDLAQSAVWWCQLIFGTFNQELFHEDDAKAIQWFQGGSH